MLLVQYACTYIRPNVQYKLVTMNLLLWRRLLPLLISLHMNNISLCEAVEVVWLQWWVCAPAEKRPVTAVYKTWEIIKGFWHRHWHSWAWFAFPKTTYFQCIVTIPSTWQNFHTNLFSCLSWWALSTWPETWFNKYTETTSTEKQMTNQSCH